MSADEANASTDISVESSVPSDGCESIEWGPSEPSIKDSDRVRRSDRNTKTMSERNLSGAIPERRRSKRWVAVVVGMIILIGCALGIYYYFYSNDISLTKRTEASTETSNTEITLEELKTHDDPTADCWVSMHDTVFDVTDYALEHPGGPEFIWDYCGTNATRAFAIEHPISYLKDLSSNTIMGVLQSSSASATTSNSTSSQPTDGEKDDSKPTTRPVNGGDDEDDDEEEDGDAGSATVQPSVDGSGTETPTTPTSCISATEVALHATREDCWYILYDQVYDFTDYIDLHPGGARYVFQECGTDATSVYVNERHHDEDLLIEVRAPDLYLLAAVC